MVVAWFGAVPTNCLCINPAPCKPPTLCLISSRQEVLHVEVAVRGGQLIEVVLQQSVFTGLVREQ